MKLSAMETGCWELKNQDCHCCGTSETAEPAEKGGIVELVAEHGAGDKLAELLQGGTLSQIQRIQRTLCVWIVRKLLMKHHTKGY